MQYLWPKTLKLGKKCEGLNADHSSVLDKSTNPQIDPVVIAIKN